MANGCGQELQQEHGRHVGDVQVFEHDDEGQLLCGVGQYVADRVHELKARLLGAEVGRFRHRLTGRKLGEDLGKRGHVRIELAGLRSPQDGAYHLHPRPIRRCAAGLPTSAPEGSHPAFACDAGNLFGETALPDARLAGQVPDGTTALCSALDSFGETRDLAVPSDDG